MRAPQTPARPSTTARALTPALLFAAFLPLYLPFRSRFLVNWDAVNFALGTLSFDLEHHQPHPPGYVGYVALGWLLNHLTGDANTSLTLLSVVSVAAAPAGLYLLASLFMERRYALWSAILFGLSPIVWYYSGVALTYAVELSLGLFFLWAGYLGRQNRSPRVLFGATTLLVVLGAMRPSGALLLMPLWLYLVWPLPWRVRLTLAATLIAGNLLWLVPLMWLSGGVSTFVQVSRELVDLVVVPTSVFGAGATAPGPVRNLLFVGLGVLVGVNFALLLIGAGLAFAPDAFRVLRAHGPFLALWLGPSVATYVLIHTGQLGYVLLILPAFFLLAGLAMEGLAARWRAGAAGGTAARAWRPRRLVPAGSSALLAIGNVAIFLVIPPALFGFVPRGGTVEEGPASVDGPVAWVGRTLAAGGIGSNPRQFDLRNSDRYWRSLIAFTKTHDADRTAVLTVADPAGSFRHLTYYLPDYRVYGLGWDLEARFGHLFTAYGRTSDYSPRNLRSSGDAVPLPEEVTTLVIPDGFIQALLPEGVGERTVLANGFDVVVVSIAPNTTLMVRNATDDVAIVSLKSDLVQD